MVRSSRGEEEEEEEEEERIWECSFIIILPKLANWSYRRRQRLKF